MIIMRCFHWNKITVACYSSGNSLCLCWKWQCVCNWYKSLVRLFKAINRKLRILLWLGWLRHYARIRKVAGSIPDCVTVVFHLLNPSGRTLALGLTQPPTAMSTRNISWGVKVAGAYGWQPYHFHMPTVMKSESLNLLEPSGTVQICTGIALPLLWLDYSLGRSW